MNAPLTSTNVNSLKIKCGTAFLRPDGIIQFDLEDDYIIEVADLKEINDALGKLNGGVKSRNMFVCKDYTNVSHEAIKFSNNAENFDYTLADVFVVKSMHQKLLANFYISIIKPPVPTKYFMKIEDAVKWLQELPV